MAAAAVVRVGGSANPCQLTPANARLRSAVVSQAGASRVSVHGAATSAGPSVVRIGSSAGPCQFVPACAQFESANPCQQQGGCEQAFLLQQCSMRCVAIASSACARTLLQQQQRVLVRYEDWQLANWGCQLLQVCALCFV
jgi:hypothetical protein